MSGNTHKPLCLLLLGCIASREEINTNPYASVPGSLWLKGFAQGLRDNGAEVHLLSHVYDRVFPYGKLFHFGMKRLDDTFPTHEVSYPNLPFLREPYLKFAYVHRLKSLLREYQYDALITYNPLEHHVAAGRYAVSNTNTKWISILLDPPEMNFSGDWEKYLSQYGRADGNVFLSWHAFETFPHANKLHMDSGVERVFEAQPSTAPSCNDKTSTILYSGKIQNTYGGSDHLLDFIRYVKNPRVKFVICGYGNPETMTQLAQSDPRIDYRGFIADQELHELCLHCDYFLNIRAPDHIDNFYTFPSKLSFYLQYLKPIFSIWTPGISPVYRDFIFFAEPNTGKALGHLFDEFLQHNIVNPDWSNRLLCYAEGPGSWKSKAKQVLSFCESLLLETVKHCDQ